MDVGGKTLGTKAMCAAQTRSVYHVFKVEYMQVTQLHQNLYLCSIHKAVSIASLAGSCTSGERKRLKVWLDTLLVAVLPYFYLFGFCFCVLFVWLFFFFLGPVFGVSPPHSFLTVKCTLQKRGEGWLCLWSLHSPDMLLLNASADVPDC